MKKDDRKEYVRVEAWFSEDGTVHPTCIIWKNGARYQVESVADVRPGVSVLAQGAGMRYTVCIAGRVTFLYQAGTRWFVERKGA
jgi:hypothetical protein